MLCFEEEVNRQSTAVEYSSSLSPTGYTKARTCRAPEPVVASGVHQLLRWHRQHECRIQRYRVCMRTKLRRCTRPWAAHGRRAHRRLNCGPRTLIWRLPRAAQPQATDLRVRALLQRTSLEKDSPRESEARELRACLTLACPAGSTVAPANERPRQEHKSYRQQGGNGQASAEQFIGRFKRSGEARRGERPIA